MGERLVFRISDSELEEILRTGLGWSAVCFRSCLSIPCDHFKGEFRAFSGQMGVVFCAEIGADENPTITERLGVKAVPTTLLLCNGREMGRFEGPYSKEALVERVTLIMKTAK